MKIYEKIYDCEIVGVDEERDEIEVYGDWGAGFETKVFSFDNFDMDFHKIVVGQFVKFYENEFNCFFTL